ncbi:histidine phosphatase family protein [Bacillus sp. SCS-151]|uniref:histidine phosphatase family protein n=1 Tax=Nanhaiella sioensis TaxID=3115293 RepID=UPI00397807E1
MEILIIRHGESEADILNVHEGRADFSLTQKGTIQAKSLASHLVENFGEFDAIWTSTLKRASETAKILGAKLKCNITYSDGLRERNNGILAGQPITKENMNSHYDLKPFESILEGETDIEFRARAETILLKILDEHNDSNRIIILSHGGMIEKLIHVLLRLPPVPNCFIHTQDTGVHLIEYNSSNIVIKYFNNTDHLSQLASQKISSK